MNVRRTTTQLPDAIAGTIVASDLGGRGREAMALCLLTELRRDCFSARASFRDLVRAGVRLSLPARPPPAPELVESLTARCLMTLLDLSNGEAAVRVLVRDEVTSTGEAIEALCMWTVRREQARLRAADRPRGERRR